MGNKILSQYPRCDSSKSIRSCSKTSKCNKKHRKNCDSFFLEFSKRCKITRNQSCDLESLDERRAVFISLIGLFQSYKRCPLHTIYSAICVLPIKKIWLYHLPQYIKEESSEELQSIVTLSIFNCASETLQFIKFLQWKDSQGLLFFMLDDYQTKDEHSLIHPFWRYFSNKLGTFYDTSSGFKYNSLHLDHKWWDAKFGKECNTKYGADARQIFCEIYFKTMKYRSMKEIIYQSNPSLNPMAFYGSAQNIEHFKRVQAIDDDDDEMNDEWFISIDYL